MSGVRRGLESSGLGEREKLLLRFVDKVSGKTVRVGAADIDVLHEAGWNDEAIYRAITVCALVNLYNCRVDASGEHALPDEAYARGREAFGGGGLRAQMSSRIRRILYIES